MEGTRLSPNLSSTNLSLLNNTDTTRAYVFVPASSTTKLIIFLLLVVVGTVGFIGNSLIYRKQPYLLLHIYQEQKIFLLTVVNVRQKF